MRQDHQAEVAALAVVSAAANVGSLTPLEHRHHGFDLGALAVGVVVKTNFHLPAIAAARRLVGGTTALGWNHRANAMLVTGKNVIAFRIIASIVVIRICISA